MRLNRLRWLIHWARNDEVFPFGKRSWTNASWFVKHGLFEYGDYKTGRKWRWTEKAIESMETAIAEYEDKRGGLR